MSRILITGVGGLVGRALLGRLDGHDLLATDLRHDGLPNGIPFEFMDVSGDDPDRVIGSFQPDAIIHLASIVTPASGYG